MGIVRRRAAIASLPLIALCHPVAAWAQTDQKKSGQDPDDIIVVGEIARNRADIELKQERTNTYDSQSEDDIGTMPDISIADAFRRLPGVTGIVNTFSSDFDTGVTDHLTIRGLSNSYNLVAVDDLVLATTGNSRDVGLSVLPSSAAKRIESYTSFSADIDGEATGGYLNLVSRSAYDYRKKRFLSLNGTLTHNTFNQITTRNNPYAGKDGMGENAEITTGARFGSNGQFGVILSGIYRERRWDQETFLRDGTSTVVGYDANGDGVITDANNDKQKQPGDELVQVPTQIRSYTYTNFQKQYGGSLKLEFKPSSNFYSYLYGFYYETDQRAVRNGQWLSAITGLTYTDPNDAAFSKATANLLFNSYRTDRHNSLIAWHTDWQPADRHVVSLDAGWSTATLDQLLNQITYATAASTALSGAYFQDGEDFSWSLDDADFYLSPASYKNTGYRTEDAHQVGIVKMAKLDYAFKQGRRDHGLGYKLGASYRDMIRKNGMDATYYTATGAGQLVGNDTTLYFDPYVATGMSYGKLYIDPDAVIGSRNWAVDQLNTVENSLRDDWRYDERDASAYGMVTWKSRAVRANAGLRYEHTDQYSLANTENKDAAGTNTFVPTRTKGGYDAWLPSATLAYSLSGLRLKASFSKTIGRPIPNEVAAPSFTDNASLDGEPVTYIGHGNPDLRPRRSTNYDAGIEYYFDKGDAMASLVFFDKEIKDEIFKSNQFGEIEGGRQVIFQVPQNADKARIRGIVAQVTKDHFNFLPGFLSNFGGSLNGTFTDAYIQYHDADDNVIRLNYLQNQSKWAGNATLFYHFRDVWQARISYNYRSKYMYNITNIPNNQLQANAYGQLDFGFRYRLAKPVTLRFDARNLTSANYRRDWTSFGTIDQNTEYGRSFSLGINANF